MPTDTISYQPVPPDPNRRRRRRNKLLITVYLLGMVLLACVACFFGIVRY